MTQVSAQTEASRLSKNIGFTLGNEVLLSIPTIGVDESNDESDGVSEERRRRVNEKAGI